MSSDSESNNLPIFGIVLTKILWTMMRKLLKKALTHKLTSPVVSRDVLTA